MERIDPALIESALLEAPGWARVGITAPSEHLRIQSARELTLTILDRLDGKGMPTDPAQLALAL